MKKNIYQPHDKLFKNLLSHQKACKDFFNHFLPKKIREKIDLNHLELADKSFIDKALKTNHADLLFNTRCGDKEAYLYLLVENQTSVDKSMPLRLWKYIINILELHQKMHPDETYLPLVYPLVFYTPKDNELWKEAIDFINLFEPDSRKLAESIFYQPFQLIDVNGIDEKNLAGFKHLATLVTIMKHRSDFSKIAPYLLELLEALALSGEMDYIDTVILYALDQGGAESPEAFIETLEAELPISRGEKKVGNIAEYFTERCRQNGLLAPDEQVENIGEYLVEKGRRAGIKKGRRDGLEKGRRDGIEKGRRDGLEKGRREGKLEGKIEGKKEGMKIVRKNIAVNMLKIAIDHALIAKTTGLSLSEIEKLAKNLDHSQYH